MKPRDKTSQKLREVYDQLDEMDTSSSRKVVREAKRTAKKHMTKHNRSLDKRELRDVMYRGNSDD